jgi:uncharacterized membrane protein YeaQ/YmgE (transglycosylase-associated protein family)
MLWFLLSTLVIGFIVGLIARALVSGPSPKGCLPTALLGIVGSFVGGFLGHILFHHGDYAIRTSSFLGSIVGAVILLLLYRRSVEKRGRI